MTEGRDAGAERHSRIAVGAQVAALALNVFREAARDRLLLIIAASGVGVLLFSLVLGEMAVGGEARVLQNTGFWLLGVWGLLAVLYLGSNIIGREIKQKTVYLILSRAVGRPTFLIGKFMGMVAVLVPAFALLAGAWLVLMLSRGIDLSPMHGLAMAFIFGEWVLLCAFSVFFASFTSPILHNFFLIALSFLGHWSNDIRLLADNTANLGVQRLLKGLYHLLPNLEALNFRREALYDLTVPPALVGEALLVWLLWSGAALVAAVAVFHRRRLL